MNRQTGLALVVLAGLCFGAAGAAAQVWEVDGRLFQPVDQLYAESGGAIAIGDFDGDGINDFVYSVPKYDSAVGEEVGRWYFVKGSRDRSLASMGNFWFNGTENGWGGIALATGDFDGDGRDEVAIGKPLGEVDYGGGTVSNAGTVLISHWVSGTTWTSPQTLSQLDAMNYSPPEQNDWFGYKLAVGNFNGDAYEDLVVAATNEDWGTHLRAGIVHVFYGSAGGLRTDNDQAFVGGSNGLLGVQTSEERLGAALAAGDFNDDGYDDLAFAAAFRELLGLSHAGEVHVLYGSVSGLVLEGQQLLNDSSFVGGAPGQMDRFGYALAAANFDENGLDCISSCYDDLAIGVPGNIVNGAERAGKVLVAYGSSAGIDPLTFTLLRQGEQGGWPEFADEFGSELAAGHSDHQILAFNRYADLVVGTPFEDIGGGFVDEGYVQLFFGASGGLDAGQQEQVLTQKRGFPSYPPQEGDRFGSVLALGDIDDDGWGDLLVGMPYRDRTYADAGALVVLYGALFADGFESGGSGNW